MNTHDQKPQQNKNAAVDWSEVEHRLQAARVAIQRIWTQTAGDTQRILKKRAQEATVEEECTHLPLAVVELDGEYFGIKLHAVQQFCDIALPILTLDTFYQP